MYMEKNESTFLNRKALKLTVSDNELVLSCKDAW